MSTVAMGIKHTGKGLDNFLSHNPMSHIFQKKPDYHKLTTVKKVFEVSVDKDSYESSKEFVKILKSVAKDLPCDKVNLKNLEKSLDGVNSDIQVLDGFIETMAKYEINDANAKKFYLNLKTSLEILYYISDYLNLALEITKDKKELALSKKIYTLEELKKAIAA